MLIWVDAFRGDRFKCVVDANDTAGEVLERMREDICECCRSHVKRVSIDGVVLEEKRTLGSYNVQQWTALRLSGGVLVKQRAAASGAEYYVPWEENDKRDGLPCEDRGQIQACARCQRALRLSSGASGTRHPPSLWRAH